MTGRAERLVSLGFAVSHVYYPLSPGKYNFQEENRNVDAYEYTKIRIDA